MINRRATLIPCLLVLLPLLSRHDACGKRPGEERKPRDVFRQEGVASWYGEKFHGKPTASGETFDMYAMTAAHRTLPFGTYLLVRNLDNGKEAILKVNDRGPFVRGRILDCSYQGAKRLDFVSEGLARVSLEALGSEPKNKRKQKAIEGKLKKSESLREELEKELSGALLPLEVKGKYAVQAGAFENPVNARDFKIRLEKEFEPVRIVKAGLFHRVQVGLFDTPEEAEGTKRRLEEMGIESYIVGVD